MKKNREEKPVVPASLVLSKGIAKKCEVDYSGRYEKGH
jgi:hypothetical protein